jgi:hypothetical protein
MNLPGNGQWLLTLRRRGEVPAGMVLISFLGTLPVDNFTLLATSGRRYDWRLIHDLRVCAVIDDGIGTPADLRPLTEHARHGECSVWHYGQQQGAWIYPDDDIVGTHVVRSPGVRSITWTSWQNERFASALNNNNRKALGKKTWNSLGTAST